MVAHRTNATKSCALFDIGSQEYLHVVCKTNQKNLLLVFACGFRFVHQFCLKDIRSNSSKLISRVMRSIVFLFFNHQIETVAF